MRLILLLVQSVLGVSYWTVDYYDKVDIQFPAYSIDTKQNILTQAKALLSVKLLLLVDNKCKVDVNQYLPHQIEAYKETQLMLTNIIPEKVSDQKFHTLMNFAFTNLQGNIDL